ncbi:MAG TPA: DMT family transporter [Thermoanaerobaculia bacterium]|nr:DMT family transporter [Thermoanaerobaculia bacterium]
MSAAPPKAAAAGWGVHGALLGAQIGFALFPIFGKLVLASIPALVLAAFRVVSAALLLEALRRVAGDRELEPRDRPAVLLYALLGVSFNQVLFILGLSMTTAIHTTILTATIPVFTLVAAVLLGRESMAARAVVGVALATAGVLVLLDLSRLDFASGQLRGDLLILANSLSYSFYLVLSRPVLARYSARTVVSRIFLYGAGPILLVAAPALLRFSPAAVPAVSWGGLAAIVVLSSVLPYLWNSWALARTEASKVAFYVFLQPLLASVLAVLVLGEKFAPRTLAAAALIFAGLAVAVAGRAPLRRALP